MSGTEDSRTSTFITVPVNSLLSSALPHPIYDQTLKCRGQTSVTSSRKPLLTTKSPRHPLVAFLMVTISFHCLFPRP